MWFLFALLTTLSWGAADLFYKKGSDSQDKYSHTKIGIMVGLVMGIHGIIYMLVEGVTFHPFDMVKYLPVSAYILSMLIGYFGLRYIELSISTCTKSSGAIQPLYCLSYPTQSSSYIAGILIITVGVIGLAVLEKKIQTGSKGRQCYVDPKYKNVWPSHFRSYIPYLMP